MKRKQPRAGNGRPVVRCGIYTRKSTEEGLEQEFNSLDAQRESAEAFIKSQAHEGWVCLPEAYDDGGFTGGNMDRPALRRLLTDIEAGKINCVVVYKVDRLSRSLLDFARMMETFEKHKVSFVSVTQQFNTATSMGRLVLNVLLSFAQFEREIISERTRDKIAAARRKGKWSGGHPLLGYDVDPNGSKLVVNEEEAGRVRDIFWLYVKHQSLLPVVRELHRLGWRNKRWVTRKGRERGGRSFDRPALYKLLTNVAYVGKIKYKNEVHKGEHQAIVLDDLFAKVQAILGRNRANGGALVRNRYGALLKDLLRCSPCGCAMGHTYTSKEGRARYRYYVCMKAHKQGWDRCPTKSVPALEIEQFVLDQIRTVARDPGLLAETLAQARRLAEDSRRRLKAEQAGLEREMRNHRTSLHDLTTAPAVAGMPVARMEDFLERLGKAERRVREISDELAGLENALVDEEAMAAALGRFDPVWETLTLPERARLVHLLVERVEYDGAKGEIALTFHPAGIKTLAAELANGKQETP